MKEIPILFSTPMVQAIIADRKTETRRTGGLDELNKNPDRYTYTGNSLKMDVPHLAIPYDNRIYYLFHLKNSNAHSWVFTCPYGQPGDLLWVRESYCPGYFDNRNHGYKADWNKTAAEYVSQPKWKPSIHMPKLAARIWLKVIDIKVERLEDITETSAIAEGVQIGKGLDNKNWYLDYLSNLFQLYKAKSSFNTLWRKINGEASYNSNPWVWVVKFEVVSKNGRPSNWSKLDLVVFDEYKELTNSDVQEFKKAFDQKHNQ